MLDYAVEIMRGLSPEGILAFAFLITFLENIFPPSPSDMLLVFCGTLAGVGAVNAPLLITVGSVGSCAGFLAMYWLGYHYGSEVLQSRLMRFIPRASIIKTEQWFAKYGYWLILANRFLSGTRAVISLFAGISRLNLPRTLTLSFAGTVVWNTLLVVGGYFLGDNWRDLGEYLSLYGWIILVGLILLAAGWFIMKRLRRKKSGVLPEELNSPEKTP